MAQYDVSRYTIRRAVGDLEEEHFINRIQGGGMLSKTGIANGRMMLIARSLGSSQRILRTIFSQVLSQVLIGYFLKKAIQF